SPSPCCRLKTPLGVSKEDGTYPRGYCRGTVASRRRLPLWPGSAQLQHGHGAGRRRRLADHWARRAEFPDALSRSRSAGCAVGGWRVGGQAVRVDPSPERVDAHWWLEDGSSAGVHGDFPSVVVYSVMVCVAQQHEVVQVGGAAV